MHYGNSAKMTAPPDGVRVFALLLKKLISDGELRWSRILATIKLMREV